MVSIARVIRVSAPGGPIGRMGRWTRAPAVIWVPALAVALVLALPLVYLVIRTVGAGDDAWALLFRWRTVMILLRTVALVVTVTAASVLIAVPVAWLTVRSNLPWPRFWSVVAALPLVIPSFVAGLVVQVALGPRGMLQQALEPIFGVTELPPIYGFPGAALTLTLLSYPYVLLPVQSSFRRQDPSFEDASRSLGHGRRATFRRVTLPLLAPAVGAGSLLVALYTLTDFGAVSLLRYETFTWAIFVQFESAFNRGLAAALSLVLVGFAAVVLAAEALARGRARFHGVGPGTTGEPTRVPLGRWMIPAFGFNGRACGACPGWAHVRAGVLGRPRRGSRRNAGWRRRSPAELAARGGAGGAGRSRGVAAGRRARRPLPQPIRVGHRAGHLYRFCLAGHRGRDCAGLLRRQSGATAVSDVAVVDPGLRRAVLSGHARSRARVAGAGATQPGGRRAYAGSAAHRDPASR